MDVSQPLSKSGANKRSEKAFSCVRCFERKVKCNKSIPCLACTKAGVECVFRLPAPPRRRKKRSQEELLLARLRRCEDILKSHGISPDSALSQGQDETHQTDEDDIDREASFDRETLSRYGSATKKVDRGVTHGATDSQHRNPGKLVIEQGRTQFFENNLYSGLNDELRENDAIIEPSSGDESESLSREFATEQQSVDFMMGLSPTNASLTSLHPPPDQIYKLWQIFLDNVNPLTKIIHQPTLQSAIFDASFNLDKIPKGLEALMFAIYSSAVYTFTEEECMDILYEDKTSILAKYRLGLRKALVRANFLASSELMVLQAFTIYLLSMRMLYEAKTMWILAGVANRLGQALGLHRDGTILGLSPFDTEMRRRLWWQIVILDSRSAELSGSARALDVRGWNTKVPSNVNDADLYPQMTYAPDLVTGKATEMISCCLRYELGEFLHRSQALSTSGFDGDWQLSNPNISTQDKDRAIDELEKRFEEKYVRYCDATIPVHFHTLIVARATIFSMRLMAHHPRHRSDKDREQSRQELDMVFTLAVKIVECDNMCHSSRVFRRFLWHTHVYFQWQAFIYLLGALRTRTEGPEVDTAWQQIKETYEHHPTLLTDTKRQLHVATGNLCLKAWQAREAAHARQDLVAFAPATPGFIQILRQQRSKNNAASAQPASAESHNSTFTSNNVFPGGLLPVGINMDMDFGAHGGFDANMLADFSIDEVSPMNWEDWDILVNGYGTSQLQDWTNTPSLAR